MPAGTWRDFLDPELHAFVGDVALELDVPVRNARYHCRSRDGHPGRLMRDGR